MKVYVWKLEGANHRLYVDDVATRFTIRPRAKGKKRFEAFDGSDLIRGSKGYVRKWIKLVDAKSQVELLAGRKPGDGYRKLETAYGVDRAPISNRSVSNLELRRIGAWRPPLTRQGDTE